MAGHVTHEVYPLTVYVFTGHMLSLKLLGQKYPAVHALHGDVPFLTNPAETHVHWLMLVDAAGDVESKGHELLVASPGQYTPATHGK
ncbi:MAG: hypothetical protein ACK56I_25715, partial [bacterium]